MRSQLRKVVEAARVCHGLLASAPGDGANGVFVVLGPKGVVLRIIASDGIALVARGWEHVSVSCAAHQRCPNWPEMCFVKDLFWEDEEAVIQFHPPRSQYVNCHPTTLHLWRSRNPENRPAIPPSKLVGPK